MKKIITLLLAGLITHHCNAQCSPAISAVSAPSGAALLNADFTNSSTFTGLGTGHYSIDYGDGTSSSIYSSAPHEYALPGTYTATLTMTVETDTFSTPICTATATTNVTVAYPPCGTVFTSSVTATTATSEDVTFTANTPSGGSISSYAWDFGDGATSTTTVPSATHTYTANGSYSPSLSVTGACGPGWTTTSSVFINSIFNCSLDNITSLAVTQVASPDKTISYNVNYTPPPAGQFCTFSWNFGDGTNSTSPAGTHTYAGYGPYTATATVNWTLDSTVTPGCTSSYSTTVTMVPVSSNMISGRAEFDVPIDSASGATVDVYLITLIGTDLEIYTTTTGVNDGTGTGYAYQFFSAPLGYYRIKAVVHYATPPLPGNEYAPTYYSSDLLWYGSGTTVLNHTSSETGNDIIMIHGTAATGAGFVGGDIGVSSTGRLTSGSSTSAGITVFLKNFTTGQLMRTTTTDSAGHYSFSNLPVDQTYYVYPELLNYTTIPFSGISLTAAAPSMATASFIKHDVAKTIVPGSTAGVANVNASVSTIHTFPSPTNGKLNIGWEGKANESGKIIVTDITGREVYTSTIDLTQGTGAQQIDLSGVENGLYMISIKSASLSYNNKIEIMH